MYRGNSYNLKISVLNYEKELDKIYFTVRDDNDNVKIAKNYLSEIELQRLNLLVSQFLDFAEFQALEMNPMTMKDWIEALDNQIIGLKRKVLTGKGRVSHKQAIEKAEKEFEIYRKREMDLLESDFDREVKKLKDLNQ